MYASSTVHPADFFGRTALNHPLMEPQSRRQRQDIVTDIKYGITILT
jgi:hypothetical protein